MIRHQTITHPPSLVAVTGRVVFSRHLNPGRQEDLRAWRRVDMPVALATRGVLVVAEFGGSIQER